MNYIEIQFQIDPFDPWSEILTAYLSELNFEGFYEEDGILKAFIPENKFERTSFQSVLDRFHSEQVQLTYKEHEIPQQNWNESWESNFQAVEVNEDLIILAPFHEQNQKHATKILIQPKMSFGTGHHQTTQLMCEAILKLDLSNKSVLDMGAGTGVLAILCEKRGSVNITAIDIEEWSIDSCLENAKLNSCSHIECICGDIELLNGKEFDYIFANINKNVLMKQMGAYSESLNENGFLYLSGFFESDIDDLRAQAKTFGMEVVSKELKENWAMLVLKK